ncbi:MAG: hypothetical protein EXR62_17535 [Chloroflexi bacterium]|nr:hypothetical protein [Chloroflexota bacterium]
MADWKCELELSSDRVVTAGSEAALCDAIRRGADLRIYTEFRHNEHIDVTSDNPELIREVAEFRETVLLEDRWAAGFMTLRQPVNLPDGFGPRPSMSFFLYNQNGQQAIARPLLDGASLMGSPGPSLFLSDTNQMPKFHRLDGWDDETNGPSSNFIYDFNVFRFWVRDRWQEVLSHAADGTVISGSVEALGDAFASGREVKVAVRSLYKDLADNAAQAMDHEVFIQTGSGYYYTERKQFMAGSHPLVRVAPAIPLVYKSHNWDFGWLFVRTDGLVVSRICDPYTLKFHDTEDHFAIRWFVQ